jgi:SAM-dependent methyltransferase
MGWIKARLKDSSDALPPTTQTFLRSIYKLLKWPDRKRTERVFNAATSTSERLPPERLPDLVDSYPSSPPYSYTAEALETRGRTRAKQILNLPGSKGSRVFLELGCWDGMVGWALARHGKTAIGIDSRSEGFDARALAAGVDLQKMDAEAMTLADNSADFVFSYDAFEHFPHPDLVLNEITRVIRPGGYVWLEFGPLYLSAFGPHIYRTIPVP